MTVTATNLLSEVVIHFADNTTPEWACAYAYCEENDLMSALFAACQDDKTEAFYKTLPVTYGKHSIACGDWATRMEH